VERVGRSRRAHVVRRRARGHHHGPRRAGRSRRVLDQVRLARAAARVTGPGPARVVVVSSSSKTRCFLALQPTDWQPPQALLFGAAEAGEFMSVLMYLASATAAAGLVCDTARKTWR
jgi:hypothetical protein